MVKTILLQVYFKRRLQSKSILNRNYNLRRDLNMVMSPIIHLCIPVCSPLTVKVIEDSKVTSDRKLGCLLQETRKSECK